MMPFAEIKLKKTYIDHYDMRIVIHAGENGWTINYADASNEYKDVVSTTENNFNEALRFLKSNPQFSDIKEVVVVMDEMADEIIPSGRVGADIDDEISDEEI